MKDFFFVTYPFTFKFSRYFGVCVPIDFSVNSSLTFAISKRSVIETNPSSSKETVASIYDPPSRTVSQRDGVFYILRVSCIIGYLFPITANNRALHTLYDNSHQISLHKES